MFHFNASGLIHLLATYGYGAVLLFNAAGGIVWATLYGLGGYFLGDNIHRLTGPIGPITLVLAVLFILAGIVIVRRNEQRLADEAERALPGPLDASRSSGKRP
jgi:hypothetical protein